MKVKMELDLRPFQVPNFVLSKRSVTDGDEVKFPLEDLPAEAIYSLLREFEREVYKKAKASPPAEPRHPCRKCGE